MSQLICSNFIYLLLLLRIGFQCYSMRKDSSVIEGVFLKNLDNEWKCIFTIETVQWVWHRPVQMIVIFKKRIEQIFLNKMWFWWVNEKMNNKWVWKRTRGCVFDESKSFSWEKYEALNRHPRWSINQHSHIYKDIHTQTEKTKSNFSNWKKFH